MLRLLHTSDLHITEGPRLADQADVLTAIVRSAIAGDIVCSVITGDLAGTAVPHVATVAERAMLADFFQRLSLLGPVVIVRGNHDNVEDIALYARLRGHHPIVVATSPESYDFETKAGPIEVYALPWVTTASVSAALVAAGGTPGVEMVRGEAIRLFSEFVESWVRSSPRRPGVPRILAGHVAIGGARTAGGEVLLGYDVELPGALFARLPVDYVALGHIHLAQEVAPRVHYAGSPSPHAFDEEDPKGWWLVGLGDVGPEGDMHMVRIPSPAPPVYTLDARYENGAWSLSHDYMQIVEGAEIRVRVSIPEALLGDVNTATLEALVRGSWAPSRIVLRRKVEVHERIRSVAMAKATTIEEQAAAAIDALVPPVDDEQRERVLARVREVGAQCGYTGST
jgi:exonuclease SbcD